MALDLAPLRARHLLYVVEVDAERWTMRLTGTPEAVVRPVEPVVLLPERERGELLSAVGDMQDLLRQARAYVLAHGPSASAEAVELVKRIDAAVGVSRG